MTDSAPRQLAASLYTMSLLTLARLLPSNPLVPPSGLETELLPSTNIGRQGFRMLSGDPTMKSRPDSKLKLQNCFRCYTGPNFGGDTAAPCQGGAKYVPVCLTAYRGLVRWANDKRSIDSETLPQKACPGGIRSNIHFPT